jgi:hypothetical protein
MSKIGTLDFTGISGHRYTFNVYPLLRAQKGKEAVYVVTRRTVKADTSVDHDLIYIGSSQNLQEEFEHHDLKDCFEKEGANCLCVYWEERTETREKIEDDLLNQYHPPCNTM